MILSKLTIKPLLYAIGVLLGSLIATGIRASVLSDRLDAAAQVVIAQHDAHVAELAAAHAERDAWKQRASESAAAVTAHERATATLRTELSRAQGEVERIDAAARKSIAAAQAAATDADRTLTRMAAQFQAQAREPDCAHALTVMANACPALGGY